MEFIVDVDTVLSEIEVVVVNMRSEPMVVIPRQLVLRVKQAIIQSKRPVAPDALILKLCLPESGIEAKRQPGEAPTQ